MNEILLFASAVFSVAFILIAWKLSKERLYSAIIVFLILISVVGSKIVEFWGYETNTGNVFYASIFLATYFLIERYGKKEGVRSIWIGVIGVSFFIILANITVALIGASSTKPLNDAFTTAFGPSIRVAFASILAYILAQNINVYLYSHLKQKFDGRYLWLRANITNLLAQIADSALFFLIAFWNVVPPENIAEIIKVSIVIKVAFMILASLLLYMNHTEFNDHKGYSAITIK
jgi:uncharacterized integral membrane protein (TIGR00697 family)